MTGAAPLLAVALLALLVGAALPVLYQLYRILKEARAVLDTAGPRLGKALDEVGQAAERLNGIGSTLEAQAQSLGPLFEAASSLGRSIERGGQWLGTAISVGGAVGPAVIAGARAFFSGTDARQPPSAQSGETP
jgi:hypothetical protein